MDIKTLLIINALITFFMAAVLIYYKMTRKVYAGFNEWMFCSVIESIGFLLLFLRGIIPDFLSVVIAMTLATSVMPLRIFGIRKFLDKNQISKFIWLIPGFNFFLLMYFTYVSNLMVLRYCFSAAGISIAAFILIYDLKNNPDRLNGVLAAILGLYCILLFSRGVFWIHHPGYKLIENSAFNAVFFAGTILLYLAWNMTFIMMNSRRVEEELADSAESLGKTVAELQTATNELKIMGGLLPICSICKKIRNDKGYWMQLEEYISEHSEARFSHSLCKECAKEHYAEFYKEKQ